MAGLQHLRRSLHQHHRRNRTTYKLTATDVGHTLRVAVTATNAGGSGKATSTQTATVTPQPPTNTALPAITGTTEEGQTLTSSKGSWTGSPTGYAYQWQNCNSAGESCTNISGATASTYKLTATDVGHTIRAAVTATNAGGSGKATSAQTTTVTPQPPANTALPAVTGTTEEGQTLTSSKGTWTGSPTGYSYQWQDCNSSGEACTNISGATATTYKLTATDVGHTIRAAVTATNAGGSGKATSTKTATVVAAPVAPSNTELPAISGTTEEGQTLTATHGTWTESPPPTPTSGRTATAPAKRCTNITGATASTHKLASSDAGHTIRVDVTATNTAGSGNATSAASATVTPQPPSNTALPAITGTDRRRPDPHREPTAAGPDHRPATATSGRTATAQAKPARPSPAQPLRHTTWSARTSVRRSASP